MAGATSIRRDWLSKSLAGTVLGLGLGLALGGLFFRYGPAGAPTHEAQLAMWTVAPVWMGVLSLVYLFRSGRQAWLWLGAANAAAYALLYAGRLPVGS